MQIQIHTDNHIEGGEKLRQWIDGEVRDALGRFGNQITRVEVHLSDLNADKAADDDKRCLLEARISGLKPIVVSHQAASLNEAVTGATDKLEKTLDRTFGRLGHH
jgi:ribosome-associated translation inhibitor RaiA